MEHLYLDNGKLFTGDYTCNQCPQQKKKLKQSIIDCYKDDMDDFIPVEEDYELVGPRPFTTQCRDKYIIHMADHHDICSNDMRKTGGLNGYVGTLYSNILNKKCKICRLAFPNIRAYHVHKAEAGANEVLMSQNKGQSPLQSVHFTAEEIQFHIEKIKLQKQHKLDYQRAARIENRKPKVILTVEQRQAEKACQIEVKAEKANTKIKCDKCPGYHTKKNYKQHCRTKRHQKAIELIVNNLEN